MLFAVSFTVVLLLLGQLPILAYSSEDIIEDVQGVYELPRGNYHVLMEPCTLPQLIEQCSQRAENSGLANCSGHFSAQCTRAGADNNDQRLLCARVIEVRDSGQERFKDFLFACVSMLAPQQRDTGCEKFELEGGGFSPTLGGVGSVHFRRSPEGLEARGCFSPRAYGDCEPARQNELLAGSRAVCNDFLWRRIE